MIRVIASLLILTMLARGFRINRLPVSRARLSMKSNDWPTYMVEFRGTDPAFRFQEFEDAARSLNDGDKIAASIQDFVTFVPEPKAPLSPLCCYLKLPNDEIATKIVQRCSTVKRIVDVWGEGKTMGDLCTSSIDTFKTRIEPQLNRDNLRWKLHFVRHGRGKVDDKEAICTQLHDVCILLGGKVDLKTPNLNLLYGEDCHTYHQEQVTLAAQLRADHEKQLTTTSTTASTATSSISSSIPPTSSTTTTKPDTARSQQPVCLEKLAIEQLNYTPLNHYFGRVVAEGPSIYSQFDLKTRPFVGTTSMNALCSHISANAAQVVPGMRVLDPFCGTASLLVAAAHLGAEVVGSDIDADGLLGAGMVASNENITTNNTDTYDNYYPKQRSKNLNFQRKNGQNQQGLCPMDNFKHYNMADKVLDFVGVGVHAWLLNADGTGKEDRDPKILKYDKFDAIISDPPFGRRERLTASATTTDNITAPTITTSDDIIHPLYTPAINMGESNSDLVTTLLQVAMCRLVVGGRLVMWLPSKAHTPVNEVEEYLNTLIEVASQNGNNSTDITRGSSGISGSGSSGGDRKAELKLQRVTAETLNEGLWRWLCVFKFE